jgi:hypothetical protein
MSGNAGACWPLQLCCDVQQRWSLLDLAALELAGPRSIAAMSGSALHLSGSATTLAFLFFLFFLDPTT